MKKRPILLILAALVLATVYVVEFTDLFAKKNIQILCRQRGPAVFFGLANKEFRLTSVKVVQVDDAKTNKHPHALWHLVAIEKAGSKPITDFLYGAEIPGMKAAVNGLAPEPLKKNTEYRIILETSDVKGQRDFKM